MREQVINKGRFKKGHPKIGGFERGSVHTEEARKLVSDSLIGKIGPNSRRWLGENAGYVAKHLWIVKHYGKATHCEKCGVLNASRYEWANISGTHKRDRSDYMQLCPSCHRLFDQQDKCRKGHKYTPQNTLVNCRGHRRCLLCKTEREKNNATTN